MFGCVVLALAVPAAAVPAVAEETGQWVGRAVLVTLSSKSVKLEDRADHTVSVTEFDGRCVQCRRQALPRQSPLSGG
jgi:hypothetical protein